MTAGFSRITGARINRFILSEGLIALVFLLGFGLRLYQLGTSSLWFDEVGVAIAAEKPSLGEALAVARTHVMAMPLDYVVDWTVARACTSETCLRLPSAIWGSLAILAGYGLFKRLAGKNLALITAFYLAISPLLIQYSQELRFYASLVFFYLTTTLLLLTALEKPTIGRWAIFSGVTLVGIGFHIYVALSLVNGLFWLLGSRERAASRRTWLGFLVSGLVVALGVLWGYFFFMFHQIFYFPSSLAEGMVSTLIGLGFFPNQLSDISWAWYGLNFFLALVGIFNIFIRKQFNRDIRLWSASSLCQVGMILGTDYLWRYWVVSRQFLPLVPFMAFLSVLGLFSLLPGKTGASIHQGASTAKISGFFRPFTAIRILLAGVLAISCIPVLSSYFEHPKSTVRQASARLAETWQAGDKVLVVTPEFPVSYEYYLRRMGRGDIVTALQGVEMSNLSGKELAQKIYLVTAPIDKPDQTAALVALGFERILTGDPVYDRVQVLWVKQR